jgi:2-amino-4-hydroxy-6-hydroxymethyldihydropteridine diphosphokinase/dihydropteroate synthase
MRLYPSPAQPSFLNAALAGSTSLSPEALLQQLKRLEADLGRTAGGQARRALARAGRAAAARPLTQHAALRTPCPQRYGPRPIDLDIIFYGRHTIDTPALQVPHPRLRERDFVLAPLADLCAPSDAADSVLAGAARLWRAAGGEARVGGAALARVLPLPGGAVWRLGERTRVRGVLNVTPDSFRRAPPAQRHAHAHAARPH